MSNQPQASPAGYGCFLILPLKYDPDTFQPTRLAQIGRRLPMTTMDLNENVKAMLDDSDAAAVGEGWVLPVDALTAPLATQPGAGQVRDHDIRGAGRIFIRDRSIPARRRDIVQSGTVNILLYELFLIFCQVPCLHMATVRCALPRRRKPVR